MNHEQLQALGCVIEHFGHDEVKHYEEGGKPPGHIAEALLALDQYRQALSLKMDDESKGRVTRDDKTAEWTPTPEVLAGEPNEPRGPSVVDRGSREITLRWAKETIGLVAAELNEAYAEFDFTRDHGSIPTGTLCQASRRLEEAMQRLGLTDEIPF